MPDGPRAALEAYLQELSTMGDFGGFFADDVEFSVVGTPQRASGAAAVEQTIRSMHQVAFDARPHVKALAVDGDRAAVELEFVGTHTGEFAGIPPTGRSVRIPYAVVYDLAGDRIRALRVYMPMQLLLEQLGATAERGAAGAHE